MKRSTDNILQELAREQEKLSELERSRDEVLIRIYGRSAAGDPLEEFPKGNSLGAFRGEYSGNPVFSSVI
jgi:hypothetical protein